MKAKNLRLTTKYLEDRSKWLADMGYPESRWITFSKQLLELGFNISLYEARETVSKYLTLTHPNSSQRSKAFKIRFSNHKPIKARELAADCDFFVGVTNQAVTTTLDAMQAVKQTFKHEIEAYLHNKDARNV